MSDSTTRAARPRQVALRSSVLALAAIATVQQVAQAQSTNALWNNRAGGDYEDIANWFSPYTSWPPTGPAANATMAIFGLSDGGSGTPSEYDVHFNADATLGALRIAGSNTTFKLHGHTLTLAPASPPFHSSFPGFGIHGFSGRTSRLRIEDGKITASNVQISSGAGSLTGSILEIGDGGELEISTRIGLSPDSRLRVDGGTVTLKPGTNAIPPMLLDFRRGTLNVPTHTGGLTLGAGQHVNVANAVTHRSTTSLNGGSYTAPSIDFQAPIHLNSGKLAITNGSLQLDQNIGKVVLPNGRLAAGQEIVVSGEVTGTVGLTGGKLTVGQFNGTLAEFTAGELNITGGSFTGALPTRLVAGQTLRVRDEIVAPVALGGGHLSVGRTQQGMSLSQATGTLEITGSDLYVGNLANAPSGNSILSSLNVSPGLTVRVSGKTTGNVFVSGGRFETGQFQGRFAFGVGGATSTPGEVAITAGGLEVGETQGNIWIPLLRGGNSVSVRDAVTLHDPWGVDGGKLTAGSFAGSHPFTFRRGELHLTAGDLNFDTPTPPVRFLFGAPALQSGDVISVSGTTRTSPQSYLPVLDGGTWRTGKLEGVLPLRSGTLHITNGDLDLAQIGNEGRQNASLEVSGALKTSQQFSATTIDDLAVKAGSLDGQFRIGQNASVHLTASDLTIGNNGPLGNDILLMANQTLKVDQATYIESGAGLTVNGGTFVTRDLYIRDNARFSVMSGTFTVTGASSIAPQATINLARSTLEIERLRLHGGTLEGSGTVQGGVFNDGLVSPGESPGVINVNGDYDQYGSLLMELAGLAPGTQYDQLVVDGDVALAGTIQLALLDGFNPQPGNSFRLISADSIVQDPNLVWTAPAGLLFNHSIVPMDGGQALVVTVVPEPAASVAGLAVALLAVRRRRTRAGR